MDIMDLEVGKRFLVLHVWHRTSIWSISFAIDDSGIGVCGVGYVAGDSLGRFSVFGYFSKFCL